MLPQSKQMSITRTILSLYDRTGNFSKPYRDAGYQVIQLDKLYNGIDVRTLPFRTDWNIHGIIAMPPCTYFSKARLKPTAAQLLEGLSTVDAVYRLVALYNPHFYVIENPDRGRLQAYIGKPLQVFPLGAFGFTTAKPTALFGRFNPVKVPAWIPAAQVNFEDLKHSDRCVTPVSLGKAFFEANP